MNQFFSFKRFGLLVRKHWTDNKKRYTLALPASIGLLITWFTFTLIVGDDGMMSSDIQYTTYFFSLGIIGTLYTSQYYSDLSSRARAINFLLVPASSFEKFVCSLFYTVVAFFVVLTAVFYLVDILMITIYNSFIQTNIGGEKAGLINVFEAHIFRFDDDTTIYLVPIFFFFAVQSLFLLGAVYFKKYNFIKTIISIFIVLVVVVSIAFLIHEQWDPETDRNFRMPAWVGITGWMVAMYLVAPLFWTVAYKRLKVKQV